MTEQFEKLKRGMNDPHGEREEINKTYWENTMRYDGTLGKVTCLYQIAASLIDIEKDLRRIETELKKRRV